MLIEIGNESTNEPGTTTMGKSLAEAFKLRVGGHRNSIENSRTMSSPL